MLLSECVFGYKNYRRGGIQSNSESLSDRLVAFSIHYYRAKLIKESKDKGKLLTGYLIQNLGKVEVIKADKNECSVISDCIIRTKNPLPKAIDTAGTSLITYEGSLDGLDPYQRTTSNRVIFDAHQKYTGDLSKWFDLGNHLYIVNSPNKILKYINIQGIFEDPSAAKSYNTCGSTTECYEGMDYEYPMSSTMIDTIYKMMMDAEMKLGMLIPQDIIANGKDDLN